MEERIHPDDRAQLIEHQIEHGQFIYSLPQEQRNDYLQIFQIGYAECPAGICKCNQSPPSDSERQERKSMDDYGSDGSFTRSNAYGANQADGY